MKKVLLTILLLVGLTTNVNAKVNLLEDEKSDVKTLSIIEKRYTSDEDEEESTTTSSSDYCSESALLKPLKLIGKIIYIIKIIIPILLIVLGMVDFAKAVMSGKSEDMGKSAKSLAMRVIAAIIIFLMPSIISMVFYLVDDWADLKTDYTNCADCLLKPNSCKTG